MAFCPNCGTQLGDGIRFCPSCGASVNAQPNAGGAQYESAPNYNTNTNYAQYDARSDVEQNKAMGVLAYIGILVLVPILAAPNSKFAKYHANQSLINIIACIAYSIAVAIVDAIFAAIFFSFAPAVITIITSVLGFGHFAFLALMIIGIVNAANGEMKPLPVIGNMFTILK